MCRRLVLALLLVVVPACARRSRGLEVALTIEPPEGAPPASLHVARIELLPCPDPVRSAAWTIPSFVSVAHAHDALGAGPLVVDDALVQVTFGTTPGVYCDLRVTFGDATHAAITQSGHEPPFQRAMVLRLVDTTGERTELTLTHAPSRAAIALRLGAFDAADPYAAMSQVIAGAAAIVE